MTAPLALQTALKLKARGALTLDCGRARHCSGGVLLGGRGQGPVPARPSVLRRLANRAASASPPSSKDIRRRPIRASRSQFRTEPEPYSLADDPSLHTRQITPLGHSTCSAICNPPWPRIDGQAYRENAWVHLIRSSSSAPRTGARGFAKHLAPNVNNPAIAGDRYRIAL